MRSQIRSLSTAAHYTGLPEYDAYCGIDSVMAQLDGLLWIDPKAVTADSMSEVYSPGWLGAPSSSSVMFVHDPSPFDYFARAARDAWLNLFRYRSPLPSEGLHDSVAHLFTASPDSQAVDPTWLSAVAARRDRARPDDELDEYYERILG